ncbi:hypothetical protein SUGI_1111300 [Cryptomeria japonica]|nr:hypothetical protein SUGI_1111300 [Cryptomeria japonica]
MMCVRKELLQTLAQGLPTNTIRFGSKIFAIHQRQDNSSIATLDDGSQILPKGFKCRARQECRVMHSWNCLSDMENTDSESLLIWLYQIFIDQHMTDKRKEEKGEGDLVNGRLAFYLQNGMQSQTTETRLLAIKVTCACSFNSIIIFFRIVPIFEVTLYCEDL